MPNCRKISADASPLHPVSGVSYLEEEDRLMVMLFDGSVWVVGGLRWLCLTEQEDFELEEPHWVLTSKDEAEEKEREDNSKKGKEKETGIAQSGGLNSEALSSSSRMLFESLENERREKESGGIVDKWDMCRINGAVGYDGAGVVIWVYECVYFIFFCRSIHASLFLLLSCRSARPADFSYKQDSQHSSTVVVSNMWSGVGRRDLVDMGEDVIEEDSLLRDLGRVLCSVKACKWVSSLSVL
jgi:hypothetical protein